MSFHKSISLIFDLFGVDNVHFLGPSDDKSFSVQIKEKTLYFECKCIRYLFPHDPHDMMPLNEMVEFMINKNPDTKFDASNILLNKNDPSIMDVVYYSYQKIIHNDTAFSLDTIFKGIQIIPDSSDMKNIINITKLDNLKNVLEKESVTRKYHLLCHILSTNDVIIVITKVLYLLTK